VAVRAPVPARGERDLGREPPEVNRLRFAACALVAAVCCMRYAQVVVT
jgi:hypothetical protein